MDIVTDKELFETFAREYPKDLTQIGRNTPESEPYDIETFTATPEYENFLWENVGTQKLMGCYDIHFLFSERAFHYFFPAFIRQTQADFNKLDTLVCSLVFLIADSADDEWSQRRLRQFSAKQLDLVEKWLNWISQKVDPHEVDMVNRAIENIKGMKK